MEPQEQNTGDILDNAVEGLDNAVEGRTTEQKMDLLGQLLKSPAGREKLAVSLGPSMHRRKFFMSLASSPTFLRQSSTIIRHRDKMALVMVDDLGGDIILKKNYRDDGETIMSYRLAVPILSICSNPMIPLDQVFDRRFDLVARCLNLSKAEIGACENNYFLSLFDVGAQLAAEGKIDGNKDLQWSEDSFEEAQEVLLKRGLTMKACFVNPRTGGVEILKQVKKPMKFATERKDLIRGILGWKDGVEIRQSRTVDANFAYFTGERVVKEGGRSDLGLRRYTKSIYAGYLIEDAPLDCATADRPDLEQIGFNLSEEIGMAANPIAVQRVKFDSEFVKERLGEPWDEEV